MSIVDSVRAYLFKEHRDKRVKEITEKSRPLIEKGNPFGILYLGKWEELDGEKIEFRVGSITANIFRYTRLQPYEIKNDQGEVIHTVQPNELIVFPHVLELDGGSEFARIKKLKADLQEFVHLMTRPAEEGADAQTIRNALCMGISHLGVFIESMGKRSGKQFTWGVDSLSEDFVEKAKKASDLASKKSGGTASNPDNLRIVCFRPSDLLGKST